jgi:hypothetical protein
MTGFKQIVEFLESDNLKRELTAACENFKILSEADLSVFVCRRLTELFSSTPNLGSKYRVNAQPFCGELKFYPDIAFFRRHPKSSDQPAIAIELKEGHSFGNAIEHDCRKLREYRDAIVRRAYLIHVVHSAGGVEFQKVLNSQKKGLKNIKGISVVMQDKLGDDNYRVWHQRRRELARAFKAKSKQTKRAKAAIAS